MILKSKKIKEKTQHKQKVNLSTYILTKSNSCQQNRSIVFNRFLKLLYCY